MIAAIEADIVARLLDKIPYLAPEQGGTVRGVSDVRTALGLATISAPAAIVEFAEERAGRPETISGALQQSEISWDVFCIASSFSPWGEGRTDDAPVNRPGVYSLLDDVFAALEGYRLPSQTENPSKLFYRGSGRFNLDSATVIYASRWYCTVLRKE